MTKKLDVVEDAVLYLPRKTIHPDPQQPRVHPDAELQASIDSQGIIQAITVRPHPEIENEWIAALELKVPDGWQVEQAIGSGISDVAFKLAEKPKSKKQQKREARAAGKQVGDPSRANGPIPSLEELDAEGSVEEELVEA